MNMNKNLVKNKSKTYLTILLKGINTIFIRLNRHHKLM